MLTAPGAESPSATSYATMGVNPWARSWEAIRTCTNRKRLLKVWSQAHDVKRRGQVKESRELQFFKALAQEPPEVPPVIAKVGAVTLER